MKKEEQWLLKEKYHGKPDKNFKKDLKRLQRGEPLDYVIGFKEFLGCRIDLSKKPLIPRPETEYWVNEAIEAIKVSVKTTLSRDFHGDCKIKILDIFAGSGCCGIAAMANNPDNISPAGTSRLNVDFVDIDAKCLAQIKINIKNNFIKPGRCRLIKSDIFKKIGKKEKYNFIFANPPYIPVSKKSKVQKSVLKYEPRHALFSGKNGMAHINKFLMDAGRHLEKDGTIYMEFDPMQKNAIVKLIKKYKYTAWDFHRDQYGRWRWVVIQ